MKTTEHAQPNQSLTSPPPEVSISLSNSDPNKTFSNGTAAPNGLKTLREQKGLSQRALARKLGIEKSRIVRLEKKAWHEISLGELELLSKGLDCRFEDLVGLFNGFGKGGLIRTELEKPFFSIEYGEGIRFDSYLKNPDPCFIGNIWLAPHRTLARDDTPRGELVFYMVSEGTVLLSDSLKQHLFKKGECFSLRGGMPYELYNPDQFKNLVARLFTFPSFIRSAPRP